MPGIKKAIIIVMFMTISILVAGCSFEPTVEKYTYKGESENWTGTYKLDYIVDFPIEDDKVYVHQKKKWQLICFL